MNIFIAHQWRWPLTDFNLVDVGVSRFDPTSPWASWHWTMHVTVLGVTVCVGVRA